MRRVASFFEAFVSSKEPATNVSLTKDILGIVFECLDLRALLNCCRVCKIFHSTIRNSNLLVKKKRDMTWSKFKTASYEKVFRGKMEAGKIDDLVDALRFDIDISVKFFPLIWIDSIIRRHLGHGKFCFYALKLIRRPELVMLLMGTFLKLSQDANPLIRGVALRTMFECITSNGDSTSLLEYVIPCFTKAAQDLNGYVRKSVPWRLSYLDGQNQQEVLTTLLYDQKSPAVAANAFYALSESGLYISSHLLSHLMQNFSYFSVWVQHDMLQFFCKTVITKFVSLEDLFVKFRPYLQQSQHAFLVLMCVEFFLVQMNGEVYDVIYDSIKRALLLCTRAKCSVSRYQSLLMIERICKVHPSLFGDERITLGVTYEEPMYVKAQRIELMHVLGFADCYEFYMEMEDDEEE